MEIPHNLDRVYLGTVNGEIVLLPLKGDSPSTLQPHKIAIDPRNLIDEEGDETAIYEIHGLKIDAIGRIVVVTAKGIYIFDPSLQNLIWKFEENFPDITDIERLEGYSPESKRLELDRSKRFAYWLVGKGRLYVIDLSNLTFVVKGMSIAQDKDGKAFYAKIIVV